MLRYGAVPPYRETRDYVRRIMTLYTGRPYSLGDVVVIRRVPVRVVQDRESGRTMITNRQEEDTAGSMRIERTSGSSGRLRGGFGTSN